MYNILLTQYSGTFIGPVARVLGYIMNFIYMAMDKVFHIQNIGLSIIIFTILIYMILLPLTIRQQKFSKMSQIMNPELNAIRKKYEGKKDQASMLAMQEETKLIYDKYGIHPTGSCLQLFIQMPILLGLYRVVSNVPAYVTGVKGTFSSLVDGIMGTKGYQDLITTIHDNYKMTTVRLDFSDATSTSNSIIDVLYKLTSDGWKDLQDSFSSLGDVINTTHEQVSHFNNFLGLDIAISPLEIIKKSFASGQYLTIVLAILIPVLAYVAQRINIKMMPQQQTNTGDPQADAMASSMKTMNMIFPLMSVYMCVILPVGLGLYWTIGPFIRTIQYYVINKKLDNMDLEAQLEKNLEKAKVKAEKRKERMGLYESQITNAANTKTRKINVDKTTDHRVEEAYEKAKTAKKGSMAAKANRVREFNDRNTK